VRENVAPPVEDARGSGIYPAPGPFPKRHSKVRSPAAFANPEERPITRTRPALETAALLAGPAFFVTTRRDEHSPGN
jgi:hypothetical protein